MMYFKKNISLIASLSIAIVGINDCSQPRKNIKIDAENIQHHIDLENLKLNQVEVFKTKSDALKQLITYQRKNNIKILTQTEFDAINDLFSTMEEIIISSLEKNPINQELENIIFNNLLNIKKLPPVIIKNLNEIYGTLSVYNQKTTSIKTRVKNVFKKQGSELSTTSAEEKADMKKNLFPSFIRNLVKYQDLCKNIIITLTNSMKKYPEIELHLLLMQIFVQDTLMMLLDNALTDLR